MSMRGLVGTCLVKRGCKQPDRMRMQCIRRGRLKLRMSPGRILLPRNPLLPIKPSPPPPLSMSFPSAAWECVSPSAAWQTQIPPATPESEVESREAKQCFATSIPPATSGHPQAPPRPCRSQATSAPKRRPNPVVPKLAWECVSPSAAWQPSIRPCPLPSALCPLTAYSSKSRMFSAMPKISARSRGVRRRRSVNRASAPERSNS